MRIAMAILLGAGLVWAAAGPAQAATETAAGTKVTVHRGGGPATGKARAASRKVEGKVVVFRGAAVAPARGARHHRRHHRKGLRRGFRVRSGQTLWIVDSRTNEIVACSLGFTLRVGGREIHCAAAALNY